MGHDGIFQAASRRIVECNTVAVGWTGSIFLTLNSRGPWTVSAFTRKKLR
jgi:hypothetical protein